MTREQELALTRQLIDLAAGFEGSSGTTTITKAQMAFIRQKDGKLEGEELAAGNYRVKCSGFFDLMMKVAEEQLPKKSAKAAPPKSIPKKSAKEPQPAS